MWTVGATVATLVTFLSSPSVKLRVPLVPAWDRSMSAVSSSRSFFVAGGREISWTASSVTSMVSSSSSSPNGSVSREGVLGSV